MKRTRSAIATLLCFFLLAAAAYAGTVAPGEKAAPAPVAKPAPPQTAKAKTEVTVKEPEYIKVQHILIAFNGAPRLSGITRTLDEAKKLAYEILAQVKKGDDFTTLMKKYSNDTGPGIYGMSNNGVEAKGGYVPRSNMVPAFGDVGFQLKVGEIGIADHDTQKSPYGYHIIKRLE